MLTALAAYRNPDGGYGHALEPDARGPLSETTATLHALEVLDEIDALDHPLADVSGWLAGVARPDGGVPFLLPEGTPFPHGPWMAPGDGSHLTFGLAGLLGRANASGAWLSAATGWCWQRLDRPAELSGYWLKFALDFLDRTPEADRARATVDRLRPLLGSDGSVPVPGGTEDERLTPLTLAPRPGGRSRALFTDAQISADLDRLESGQRDDGGWDFDWLAWSPAQATESRGLVTLRALHTLRAHGRLAA